MKHLADIIKQLPTNLKEFGLNLSGNNLGGNNFSYMVEGMK